MLKGTVHRMVCTQTKKYLVEDLVINVHISTAQLNTGGIQDMHNLIYIVCRSVTNHGDGDGDSLCVPRRVGGHVGGVGGAHFVLLTAPHSGPASGPRHDALP